MLDKRSFFQILCFYSFYGKKKFFPKGSDFTRFAGTSSEFSLISNVVQFNAGIFHREQFPYCGQSL
jgi:hypothetical protein